MMTWHALRVMMVPAYLHFPPMSPHPRSLLTPSPYLLLPLQVVEEAKRRFERYLQDPSDVNALPSEYKVGNQYSGTYNRTVTYRPVIAHLMTDYNGSSMVSHLKI